jgi:hypothetical protein
VWKLLSLLALAEAPGTFSKRSRSQRSTGQGLVMKDPGLGGLEPHMGSGSSRAFPTSQMFVLGELRLIHPRYSPRYRWSWRA